MSEIFLRKNAADDWKNETKEEDEEEDKEKQQEEEEEEVVGFETDDEFLCTQISKRYEAAVSLRQSFGLSTNGSEFRDSISLT